MQQDFQYAEIGVAQFCPLDAPGGMRDQLLKRFHKNEPDMHAAGVLPWNCPYPLHFNFILIQIVLMSIYHTSNKKN